MIRFRSQTDKYKIKRFQRTKTMGHFTFWLCHSLRPKLNVQAQPRS